MKKGKQKKSNPKLRDALSDVSRLDKDRPAPKDAAIIFRVSAEEKEEIRAVAERLGLSVSGYLLDLHRIARERLGS
jgi:hypothetical protein